MNKTKSKAYLFFVLRKNLRKVLFEKVKCLTESETLFTQ